MYKYLSSLLVRFDLPCQYHTFFVVDLLDYPIKCFSFGSVIFLFGLHCLCWSTYGYHCLSTFRQTCQHFNSNSMAFLQTCQLFKNFQKLSYRLVKLSTDFSTFLQTAQHFTRLFNNLSTDLSTFHQTCQLFNNSTTDLSTFQQLFNRLVNLSTDFSTFQV